MIVTGWNVMPNESESTASSTDKKTEDNSTTLAWIRNVAALVGVLATIAGIIISVLTLRDKAKTDERTATISLESERIKLKIAESQMNEDLTKQQLIVDHETAAAALEASRAENEKVASLISHLFSENESSEGYFALLFRYASEQAVYRSAIENAIVARLGNPRSVGEITLALRLLEKLPDQPLETVVDCNRNARLAFDRTLLLRFQYELSNRLALAVTNQSTMTMQEFGRMVWASQTSVTDTSELPVHYARATLRRETQQIVGRMQYEIAGDPVPGGISGIKERLGFPPKDGEMAKLRLMEALYADEIKLTQQTFERMVGTKQIGSRKLELQSTYLVDVLWPDKKLSQLDFDGAYIADTMAAINSTSRLISIQQLA